MDTEEHNSIVLINFAPQKQHKLREETTNDA